MTKKTKRKARERRLQTLLGSHPYLLDKELLNHRGKIERRVTSGRLDIDFETENGWIIVECKITSIKDKDVEQLCRYLDDLQRSGETVYKAYLVGRRPHGELSTELLNHPPGITVVYLQHDIPAFLVLSEGRHYFNAELEKCPYDNTSRIPGTEIELDW